MKDAESVAVNMAGEDQNMSRIITSNRGLLSAIPHQVTMPNGRKIILLNKEQQGLGFVCSAYKLGYNRSAENMEPKDHG